MTFSDFRLAQELQAATKRMGFQQPTPIQREAIPPIQAGRDILAGAETGSGKTAAFLLPIMDRLLPMQRGATRALVIAPTRELAAQIAEHFKALAGRTALTVAAVHGGVSMGPQERAFKKGVDLIVATPGRLLDHLTNTNASLEYLQFLVLDEADRMLDMGFLPDIRRILAKVPKDRQTLLFSATIPAPIVELARDFLNDPVQLNIEKKSTPARGITHSVYPVPADLKQNILLELLSNGITGSVLAFTRTKHRADKLAKFLDHNGVACERIHGNLSQSQRNATLSGFKQGKFQVLVATDIAARGIDVEALGSVVNFDVPHVPEDYIHRVGRTARAQATGDALTLVSPDEERDFSAIERYIGKRLPRKNVEGFSYKAERPEAQAPRILELDRAPRRVRGPEPRGHGPERRSGRPDWAAPRGHAPREGGHQGERCGGGPRKSDKNRGARR